MTTTPDPIRALIADAIRSSARAEWHEVPDGDVCEVYPDDTAAHIVEELQRAGILPESGGHTSAPVTLIRFDASRDEIIAHLDAHPEWERRQDRSDAYHDQWQLTLPPTDPWGPVYSGVQSVHVRIPTGSWHTRLASYLPSMCTDATHTINAVALRLPPDTDWDTVERMVAASQTLDPGHPATRILSGQADEEVR